MESVSPEVQELISKIAKKNGITNFTLDTGKSVSNEGDGYMGILGGCTIMDKDSDKKLHLVSKRASANANLRKVFPVRVTFLREIVVYDEIFPEFKAFQEEHNIPHPFDNVTELYGYISDEFKEILFLRNLKEDGYKMCNRKEPMNPHHLRLGLIAYARFHAVSHAMKKLQPERYERVVAKLKKYVLLEFQGKSPMEADKDKEFQEMINGPFFLTLKVIKDNPRLVRILENLKKEIADQFFTKIAKEKYDPYSVVLHGDCWSANMLWKYEDESSPNIPTGIKLIDWQLAFLGYPIRDVSYFFYMNAAKQELNEYMEYLKVYHTALCENLSAFGIDSQSFYPFDLLLEQWKTSSKLGFLMCLVMMNQTLSDSKTHDFEKMAEEGQPIFDLQTRTVINDGFKRRMTDLIEFLDDNQFI